MLERGLALCLLAARLFAQPAPTFKSSATVVEVTTVVRDDQGKAVARLTKDDFQLFDTGKQQPISSFEVHTLQDHRFAFLRSGSSVAAASATLPNHFVAFVVDDQNLVPEHMPLAIVPAIRRVMDLQPADRAAVVSTSGRMIVPFTGDRDRLRDALSHLSSMNRRTTFDVTPLNPEIRCALTYLKADWIMNGDPASMRNCVPAPNTPVPATPVPQRPAGGLTISATGDVHQIFLESQVRGFAESIVQAGDRDVQSYFAGLARVIGAMSTMPGERSIILLSPGMYIPPRLRKLQDWTIESAVRAQVVISGVDPRGVYIKNDAEDPSTWTDAWGIAEVNERNGFMENVTAGTGGNFIRGDNDIEGALRRLDSTPEFAYVLGFSPAQFKPDGKYHPLKVVVKHSRGLTVNARPGYYAASASGDTVPQLQRQMEAVFFSSREMHDLSVALQLRSSHKPGANIVLTAIAQIDITRLQVRKEEALNRGDLKLAMGLFDANGNLVKDSWKEIALSGGDDALASLRRSGVEVKVDFEVTPGKYLVRVLVQDTAGQAMGTKSTSVEIRP
jgi:VWFA-related protein